MVSAECSFLSETKEIIVNLFVIRQLGMEAGDEQAALFCRDNAAVMPGKHFDFLACFFNPGSTDENKRQGIASEGRYYLLAAKAVELTAVGVAPRVGTPA